MGHVSFLLLLEWSDGRCFDDKLQYILCACTHWVREIRVSVHHVGVSVVLCIYC